jgi:hypothetical protein
MFADKVNYIPHEDVYDIEGRWKTVLVRAS